MSCRLGYVKLVKFLFQALLSVMSSFCQVFVKFCQVSCVILSSSCLAFVKCYVSCPIKCHVKSRCTLLPYCLGLQYCVLQVLGGNIYFWIREGVKIFTSLLIVPPFCVGGHL